MEDVGPPSYWSAELPVLARARASFPGAPPGQPRGCGPPQRAPRCSAPRPERRPARGAAPSGGGGGDDDRAPPACFGYARASARPHPRPPERPTPHPAGPEAWQTTFVRYGGAGGAPAAAPRGGGWRLEDSALSCGGRGAGVPLRLAMRIVNAPAELAGPMRTDK
jgi:hypothetical protein